MIYNFKFNTSTINEYDFQGNARPARAQRMVLLLLTISVFFMSLLLTGCSGRELDSIAIVTCIEITAVPDSRGSQEYRIQAEIVRLSDTESEPGQNTEVISASANSFRQCIEDLNEAEVLHIYLGHLRLIIFDKSFLDRASRSELEDIADFALENHEIRFNTVIAASAEDFGKAVSGESASTGNRGMDLSERIRGLHVRSELCDLINNLENESDPVSMPVITVSEMNGKSITVVKSEERYELDIAA